MLRSRIRRTIVAVVGIHVLFTSATFAQRQMEPLGRGIVAVPQDAGKVFVGWRLLGTDPDDIAFNVYRATAGAAPVKLNSEPIRNATNFVDTGANSREALSYFVRPLQEGRELDASAPFALPADAPARPYI